MGISRRLDVHDRLFLLAGGKADGAQIVPDGWVTEAARPQSVSGQPVAYGYLLWLIPQSRGTIHEGAFAARGIFGQHLYMNPKEKVVVVVWSTLPKPFGKAPVRDDDFFAAVAQALR